MKPNVLYKKLAMRNHILVHDNEITYLATLFLMDKGKFLVQILLAVFHIMIYDHGHNMTLRLTHPFNVKKAISLFIYFSGAETSRKSDVYIDYSHNELSSCEQIQ